MLITLLYRRFSYVYAFAADAALLFAASLSPPAHILHCFLHVTLRCHACFAYMISLLRHYTLPADIYIARRRRFFSCS